MNLKHQGICVNGSKLFKRFFSDQAYTRLVSAYQPDDHYSNLFVISFCDKFGVFNHFENLNKAYRVCLRRVVTVANFIVSMVLIPPLSLLLDSELLSLPAESALPFT